MNWYEMNKDDLLNQLEVNAEKGLLTEEIAERQNQHGKNEFCKQEKSSIFQDILHQLKDISTLILLFASALSFALAFRHQEGFIEPLVILGIIVMNITLAITQERSAEKALDALSDLNSPYCIVRRGGVSLKIETAELVPGDIILLKTGDLVPADARLLESINLFVDESALTGESEPSEKDTTVDLSGKVPLGDQLNMVFSGCLVTAGSAVAVVTSTGMHTQMGKIAGYLNNSQKIKTPLQKRLDRVAKTISAVAIISAVFLFILGILQGEDFWNMMLLAVTLAVAAVPETLSLIVTLSLTHGVKKMVTKNALIRKLPAVETLGNTSIICSDKTGTLTQNKMAVQRLWIPSAEAFKDSDDFSAEQTHFLSLLALAGNASAEKNDDGSLRIIGDPTESAIIRLLHSKEISKQDLQEKYPRVGEIPFSSERKMMTVIVENPTGGYLVLTKGALDRVPFALTEEMTEKIHCTHDSFAESALRVIALGMRQVDTLPSADSWTVLEQNLTFCGIIGLIDPPRPEAAIAVERAKKAGIRTIMITGDHAVTAGAIAKNIGILDKSQEVITGTQLSEMDDEQLCRNIQNYSVYARVSPEDKIRIVEAWQEHGEVVSMTGDGVNDAPALKAADVGVAMGQNGTEVAKNASDMVLTDDNFSTIIDAVEEGRNVYSNIRKTIYFLLVCNLSEIIIMLVAQLSGWGVAVTPVMLLLINVLGDGIPGLHLSHETSDPRIMDRGPIRRKESFLGGGLLRVIIQQTLICSLVVLIGFYVGRFIPVSDAFAPSQEIAQTMAFLILGWTSILHIFTVRSRKSIFKRKLLDNVPLVLSALAMIALFSFLAAVPAVGSIFGLTAIGASHWLICIGVSFLPLTIAEIVKLFDNYFKEIKSHQYDNRVVHHQVTDEEIF